ncbi:hypothetical protein [Clostridium sp.]|uniref:hypothetical protein n=1 Tax=Clostridium sp. TaxID=1506 RepID=UPI0026093B5C|nr:hypothetical protein [Clostridium sp.]
MNQIYYPGEKLSLWIEDEETRWEIISVDNTRSIVKCKRIGGLETIIKNFEIESIAELAVSKVFIKNK